jgi:hypothetical protein
MKIAIYTLPKPPAAFGGEDQMATFMVEELVSMGVEADIYHPYESHLLRQSAREYACLISNSVSATSPVQPAAFWHFNESFDSWEKLSSMGYTHLFTNSANYECQQMLFNRTGLSLRFLPLAAPERFIKMEVAPQIEDGSIGYIGNFNEYKASAVERWLVPLSKAFGPRFKIWGGTAWKRHELAKHYQGVLPTDQWNSIPEMAHHWVNFRSEAQGFWNMLNDRVYWLLAAGARYVHTDPGTHGHLPIMVSQTPDEMISKIRDGHGLTRACDGTRFMIANSNLYHHRLLYMLHVMGVRQVAKLGN